MKSLPEIAMNGEVAITSVLHDGWNINVLVKAAERSEGLLGSAALVRDGVCRCRLTACQVFDTPQQAIAVLVAKADKWIALQASFGARV
jgi:hypothetical protein